MPPYREGKQSILAFIEPEELFGELAMFEQGQRDEYAKAVEPSTVIIIPGEYLQELMGKLSDLTLAITKEIGLRRRRIERRLKNLLCLSNRQCIWYISG